MSQKQDFKRFLKTNKYSLCITRYLWSMCILQSSRLAILSLILLELFPCNRIRNSFRKSRQQTNWGHVATAQDTHPCLLTTVRPDTMHRSPFPLCIVYISAELSTCMLVRMSADVHSKQACQTNRFWLSPLTHACIQASTSNWHSHQHRCHLFPHRIRIRRYLQNNLCKIHNMLVLRTLINRLRILYINVAKNSIFVNVSITIISGFI